MIQEHNSTFLFHDSIIINNKIEKSEWQDNAWGNTYSIFIHDQTPHSIICKELLEIKNKNIIPGMGVVAQLFKLFLEMIAFNSWVLFKPQ